MTYKGCTRKAWKALSKKRNGKGNHHDRGKCGVCARPLSKKRKQLNKLAGRDVCEKA